MFGLVATLPSINKLPHTTLATKTAPAQMTIDNDDTLR
jgi:hypothetical protein